MHFNLTEDINKKVHFIGIGGISMSGLAEILLNKGYKVSGSDRNSSSIIEKLEKNGAKICIGHNADNVIGADIVVYTAAIAQDNPEILKAKELNIPLMDRAEFLGSIMKGHKFNVAVSGTHGKTTTTSMLSNIALAADTDPTILVGGELDAINGNVRCGNSQYFITEACEYKASFLKFYPFVGIILNIEADHLDYYRDINHIEETFDKFAHLIPEDGYLVTCAEDERAMRIASHIGCNVITYGISQGDVTARYISYDTKGCGSFDVYKEDSFLFKAKLNVPGRHNILNALASICAALSLNIDKEYIVEGLNMFRGAHRRFEIKGVKDGVTVVDDYAHHPTEIKAALSAAKNYPHKKIYCVFQPHTYSRTKTLFDGFTKAFFDADELILADIYAAREKDTHEISSNMLGDKIRELGVCCENFHSFENIAAYLKTKLGSGDLLITVGAGDVYKVGEIYLDK